MNIVKLVFVCTPSLPAASLSFTGFGAVVGAAVRSANSLNKLAYHQTPGTQIEQTSEAERMSG